MLGLALERVGPVLPALAHLRGWSRSSRGWTPIRGDSPVLFSADGRILHLSLLGYLVPARSEAEALAYTVCVPRCDGSIARLRLGDGLALALSTLVRRARARWRRVRVALES